MPGKNSCQVFMQALESARDKLLTHPIAATEAGRLKCLEVLENCASLTLNGADKWNSRVTPMVAWASDYAGALGILNPDNKYQYVFLQEGGEYELTIHRGNHCQLTFQIMDGNPLSTFPKSLMDIDFTAIPAGSTKVVRFGGKNADYPMPAGAMVMFIRQTFSDWEKETPSLLKIRRVNVKLEDTRNDDRFVFAANMLEELINTHYGMTTNLLKVPANLIAPPKGTGDQGLAGQYTILVHYKLEDDECLVITSKKTGAPYQGIMASDTLGVTGDFALSTSSLSLAQVKEDADGFIRYVVSKKDPNVHNWLSTDGENEGFIFMRWQGKDEAPEPVNGEIIKLASLEKALPAGSCSMTKEMRLAQILSRQNPPCTF